MTSKHCGYLPHKNSGTIFPTKVQQDIIYENQNSSGIIAHFKLTMGAKPHPNGYITNFETGGLTGVNIWSPELKLGTSSNTYGFYSFTLPQGVQIIRLTYFGYESNQFEITLDKNIEFDFRLKPSNNMLNEVDVVASKGQTIQEQVQMSKMEVPIKQLKSLPAILGEVDIMKTLQLLPGVQSGGEGTSGLMFEEAPQIKT